MATTTQKQIQTQRAKKVTAGAKQQAKTTTSTASKKSYGFAAGTVVMLTHNGLRRALTNHLKMGTIVKDAKGYKLTAAGVNKFSARVADNPEAWAEIAAFVHGKGQTPKAWAGQPVTEAGPDKRFPNQLYWGSFSTASMRLAFAALWAK